MDVSQALTTRRSTRDFRPDPLPDGLVRACLDDARWAPSWSNTQPYRVAVAEGAQRDRLRDAYCARHDASRPLRRGSLAGRALAVLSRSPGLPDGDFHAWRDYPAELQPARRATGFGLYGVLGIAREDADARDRQMRRNYEFFGAPTVLFVFAHRALGMYAALDAGIFVQSLVLAAHARGVATCVQGALAVWSSPVRAEFAVPDHYGLLVGISVGFAADTPVNRFNPGRPPLDGLLLPPL